MSKIRDHILSIADIESEIITVKQWGVNVEVRGLSGKQRAKFLKNAMVGSGKNVSMDFEKMYADLVILSSFDPESGEQIFKPEDRDLLNEKSGASLEQIAQVAMRLSGLDSNTQENIEKNLSEVPKEPSTSH